jgi:1,2-diacylglycerol 3-alpha-glucosyltransferase
MIIVIVIDQYDSENDAPESSRGAAIWASRFVTSLRERGHEVRVVSTGLPEPDKYIVKTKVYPFINNIVESNGFTFGRVDDPVVREAFKGADIIHFMLPFKLSYTSLKIAQEMDIPVFSAFHCQPENVTYNLGLSKFRILSKYIYGRYNRMFYKYFDHIHCPTQFIADQLVKYNYKGKLHVISNGVDEDFQPTQIKKPKEYENKFIIGMVGRLASEKRQDLIIQAVALSKYKDDIQLIFCGQGPKELKYKKLSEKLGLKASFGFYKKDDLIPIINTFDLYVHAAEIEIEAIACWEALACGKVPIIANAPNSATKFFALDDRSLFENKNPADLCKKIEYWIEHPEEKEEMSKKYIETAKNNTLAKSITEIERVYEYMIEDYRDKKHTG